MAPRQLPFSWSPLQSGLVVACVPCLLHFAHASSASAPHLPAASADARAPGARAVQYKAEGIDVIDVAYQDNTPCLELLENKPARGRPPLPSPCILLPFLNLCHPSRHLPPQNAGGKPGGIFPMVEEELTTPGGSNQKVRLPCPCWRPCFQPSQQCK